MVIQRQQAEIEQLQAELAQERMVRQQRSEPILAALIDCLNVLAANAKPPPEGPGNQHAARLLKGFVDALDGARQAASGIQIARMGGRLQG